VDSNDHVITGPDCTKSFTVWATLCWSTHIHTHLVKHVCYTLYMINSRLYPASFVLYQVYVDSQLESVDFRFDQLDYQIRLTKKMLTSSLQSSIRERKRMINSEEASCQQKISHIKSLIKQYEASQASYKEPEYKVKVSSSWTSLMAVG